MLTGSDDNALKPCGARRACPFYPSRQLQIWSDVSATLDGGSSAAGSCVLTTLWFLAWCFSHGCISATWIHVVSHYFDGC